MQNLFDRIPEKAAQEVITELLTAKKVRIERIVSFGQGSPDGFWYDQPENEWVLLLEGSAQIQIEERHVAMRSGDYLYIPARTRHRVEKTAEKDRTVWLTVFMAE